MAEKVRMLRITWENDKSFEMETKLDGGAWETITQMDENDYFANLWESTEALCKKYFEREIALIGAEMKA